MRRLIDLYPSWYTASPEFVALQAAYSALTDDRDAMYADVLAQLNLDTATWGLDLWEDRLSLAPDETLSLAERRARIRTRLDFPPTISCAYLAELAARICGGSFTFTEDNPDSRVIFRWDHRGYPAALPLLMDQLFRVVPAHIEPLFVPAFARWLDIEAGALTFGDANEMTWLELMSYELPET